MPRRRGTTALAKKIGARIRALRTEAKITQEQLAWSCDLDKGFMSQVESGKRLPSVPVLAAIATRLELDLVDVLAIEPGKPKGRLLDAARKNDPDGVQDALRRLGLK